MSLNISVYEHICVPIPWLLVSVISVVSNISVCLYHICLSAYIKTVSRFQICLFLTYMPAYVKSVCLHDICLSLSYLTVTIISVKSVCLCHNCHISHSVISAYLWPYLSVSIKSVCIYQCDLWFFPFICCSNWRLLGAET